MYLVFIISFLSLKLTEKLYYKEPTFPLHYPNFTLGGLFEMTNSSGQVNVVGIDRAIAMMCTLKEFNEGNTGSAFKVEGVFNGLIYDAGATLTQSEYSAMKLLKYNLRNETGNKYKKMDINSIQIGAIITGIDTDIFFATQPVFTGFPLAFIGVQFLSTGIGSNTTLDPHPFFKARIVPQSFVISASATSSIAEGIVKMLQYFNWSLVTVVYGSDAFGMEGQAFLQPLLQENSILTICNFITKTSDESIEPINFLSKCLSENDSRVVIIWSGASTKILVQLAQSIQSKTSCKLVFITPGVELSSAEFIPPNDLKPISTSFVFKNINLVPFTDSFRKCIEEINPSNQTYFNSEIFQEYWQKKFNCPVGNEECLKTSVLATTIEINQSIDATLLILKTINLMQNNCSYLNNLLDEFELNIEKKNYCQIETFTAADIYQIVNLVLYLGLPDFLTLGTSLDNGPGSLKSLQILQINQDGQIFAVGNYSSYTDTLKINNDSLYWTDGIVPESGKETSVIVCVIICVNMCYNML